MFHIANSAQNPAFCGLWVHSLKTSDKVLKYGENNRVDFSEHPTVSTNWLIVILNPIPIIYAAFRVRNIMRRKYDVYAPAAFAVQTLFLAAMPFIPQSFSASIYCFTLSLCLHSATGAYLQHKSHANT